MADFPSLGFAHLCIVIAKEAAMNETIRAFLYGALILATALIPPVISLMQKFAS